MTICNFNLPRMFLVPPLRNFNGYNEVYKTHKKHFFNKESSEGICLGINRLSKLPSQP